MSANPGKEWESTPSTTSGIPSSSGVPRSVKTTISVILMPDEVPEWLNPILNNIVKRRHLGKQTEELQQSTPQPPPPPPPLLLTSSTVPTRPCSQLNYSYAHLLPPPGQTDKSDEDEDESLSSEEAQIN